MAASADALRVSRPGTLTAVTVVAGSKEPFTVVSVSAMWERPLDTEGPIWADASAYRLLSVPTPLIGGRLPLHISAAGTSCAATASTETSTLDITAIRPQALAASLLTYPG